MYADVNVAVESFTRLRPRESSMPVSLIEIRRGKAGVMFVFTLFLPWRWSGEVYNSFFP